MCDCIEVIEEKFLKKIKEFGKYNKNVEKVQIKEVTVSPIVLSAQRNI